MGETSFKETWANFMSYVKLFAFLAVAGVGGWYYYQNIYLKRPVATQTVVAEDGTTAEVPLEPIPLEKQTPSVVLRPVLATNLAVLKDEFNENPVELSKDFTPAAGVVNQGKATEGKMQAAWSVADQICRELQAARMARNIAAKNLKAQMKVQTVGTSSAPASKTQLADEEKKRDFFQKSAEQRWGFAMAERKKKIDALMSQLQSAELAGSQ